jgi:hypothetical protein
MALCFVSFLKAERARENLSITLQVFKHDVQLPTPFCMCPVIQLPKGDSAAGYHSDRASCAKYSGLNSPL